MNLSLLLGLTALLFPHHNPYCKLYLHLLIAAFPYLDHRFFNFFLTQVKSDFTAEVKSIGLHPVRQVRRTVYYCTI